MDLPSRRQIFIDRVVGRLATSLGFHPVAMVAPELTPFDALAPNVLLRRHPDGYRQMMVLLACESPDEIETHRRRIVDFAAEHADLAAETRLRIFCVYIGPGALPHVERRKHLEPVRMSESRIVVRSFWLSLDRRRLFAYYSPWGFAPSFEINPCDPDENVFVELVRKDRYLSERPAAGLTEEFHRRALAKERTFLSGLAGKNVLVWTLLAVNVLAWAVLELTGGSQSAAQLIRAGAKSNGLIRAGQTWRLVTPIFLHYGLFHLVLNSLGLLFLGEVIEHIYGTRQFALVYFVSGIVSVVASFFFGGELMVGASGAIFGLAGALVVYGYRYRRRIPRRYSAWFGGGILPLVIINIILGILIPRVDNSAHVAGLLTGMLVTLLLKPLADEVTSPRRFALRHLAALAVTGVVIGAVLVGGVYFVRFGAIYDTDAKWMTRVRIPAELEMRVPASWVATPRTDDVVAYRSICYPARLEAVRITTRAAPRAELAGELARLRKLGFLIDAREFPVHYNGLTSVGRYELRLTRPDGLERTQVFLWLQRKNALVSIGIEIPEVSKLAFVNVQERMLAPLPIFRTRTK